MVSNNRRRFVMVLLFAACAFGQLSATEQKPNILFIVGDDMGYADVECRLT